jgi:hypothetical protein
VNAVLAPVAGFILSNTPPPEFNPDTVTPGPWGFFAIFFVAAVTVLLGMDLARRIRRTNYRVEVRERLAAEVAERDARAAEQNPEQKNPEQKKTENL